MIHSDDPLPPLASDVVVRPLDDNGRLVVKNPRRQTYLRLGEQEAFLLQRLDGRSRGREVAEEFERQFAEPLSPEDLRDFVDMADGEGLVEGGSGETQPELGFWERTRRQIRKQNWMFFRVKVFDPDKILNWLEPRTRWLFSRQLAVAAALGTLAALLVMWANRHALFAQILSQLTWKTVVLAWLTTIVTTLCHEFGHGLACKRYGGEVREMGALWIFLTPCFYCNVSDAWLLSSRWRRLLISMAGTYVDILIWIASVFVWRLTVPDSPLNYMAWIVATTCGLRAAFNLNPLLRLDGYYAASDLLGIPNLRTRSRQRWMEHVRWLLWGAARPGAAPDGRALLIYGVCSWVFTVGLLNLVFFKITGMLRSFLGVAGVIAGATMFVAVSKRYFRGSLGGEFTQMVRQRRRRLLTWSCLFLGVLLIPVRDRVGGSFHVRPAVRWEVRAPVAGFVREVRAAEGLEVPAGAALVRLEVPELTSRIAQKEAEILESRANLRRLEAGPRPEAVSEQRNKVARAETWRDLARSDLKRARLRLDEELSRLDLEISQTRLESDYQNTMFVQSQKLYDQGGLAGQQLMAQRKQALAAEAELQRAEAAARGRQAAGVLEFEAELALRDKQLADTKADLALLLAGSRPEDIEAEQARLSRLLEEAKHLASQQHKQLVLAPAGGTVTTPRLNEKVGQYLNQGDVICIVEDPQQLEAEIAIAEQDARVLNTGQPVSLKLRALPFRRLEAEVDRIAPAAAGAAAQVSTQAAAGPKAPNSQNTVTVYCHLPNDDHQLRSGMTGYGRVYQRTRPLGWIALTRTIRLVRTEFWW